MVRDVFRLAKENAPAIIFIDEVDAIATARFDAQTGADRSPLLLHLPLSLSSTSKSSGMPFPLAEIIYRESWQNPLYKFGYPGCQ